MKKTFAIFVSVAIAVSLFSACTNNESVDSSVPSGTTGVDLSDVSLSLGDSAGMDFGFTDRDLDSNATDGNILTAEQKDGELVITKSGIYVISGEITDTPLHIKAGDNDKIQLILDNATITNQNGCAIYIESADKVFITSKQGTKNTISDGSNYSTEDADGSVFSRADLTFNGYGELTVNGNTKHGIVCKDELVIVDTTLKVNATNVAINGKDCVKIKNATLDLSAGSDGIRSDNAEDTTRGFVYVESGKISITSGNDGIQAETIVKIQTADINIVSGGGSAGRISDTSESYKGIKATSDVIIHDGNFIIDSLDDAIHSNNTVVVEDGAFVLSSGDDGIHADSDLAICSGTLTVKKSYEALEGSRIFITGGENDLTASDDGLNAAGGNDQSSENNPNNNQSGGRRPQGGFGNDMFDNGVGEIYISGGFTHVNASGDGIDSNGSIEISGGVTLVSGPTNNGNGSFDYGKSATVSGGVLIATGSSGMAQGFSESVNQGAMLVTVGNIGAGTSISICDESGKCIASFTPDKQYQTAVITAPEIQQGKKYTLYSGATVENADKYGYASNTVCNGGNQIAEISMDFLLYGMGGGFGGPAGGGRPNGNKGDRPDAPPDGFGGGGYKPPQNNG